MNTKLDVNVKCDNDDCQWSKTIEPSTAEEWLTKKCPACNGPKPILTYDELMIIKGLQLAALVSEEYEKRNGEGPTATMHITTDRGESKP